MARHCVRVFLMTLLCSAAAIAAPANQQHVEGQTKPQETRQTDPPRWKWWLHAESRKEIGLSDKQVKKIDEIFETTIPKQRERWQEIQKLDDELSRLIKDNTADVAIVTQLVEKVEKLRAEDRSTHVVMVYRMYLLLNAEQRSKVDAIRARLEEERRRREEERRRQGKSDDRHQRGRF